MKTRLLVFFAFVMSVCGVCKAQTYRGMVDVSYAFDYHFNSFGNLDYFSVSTSHGVQLNRNHFVGLGIEYSPWSQAENLPVGADDIVTKGVFDKSVPLYAIWRMDFFRRKCSPFFDVRTGYQIGGAGGFYGGVNVGLRITMGRRSGFNISLGAEFRRLTYRDVVNAGGYDDYGYWSDSYVEYDKTQNGCAITARLGFDF